MRTMEEETKFVAYDRNVFEKSLRWLADEEIKYLTQTPDTGMGQKEEWFSSLPGREDYMIWGVKYGDSVIGAVGIKEIDREKGSGVYWGYIGEKRHWGKGIGKMMVAFAIGQAKQIGLRTLSLNVIKDNQRARSLYGKMGFRAIRERDGTIEMKLAIR